MTSIDIDHRPLECEERASMATDEFRVFLQPYFTQNGWKHRIVENKFNQDERFAYTQVELVGPYAALGQLKEIQPRLEQIAHGYCGIQLHNHISVGPMNLDAKDPELYGLPVDEDEASLYAVFGFPQ